VLGMKEDDIKAALNDINEDEVVDIANLNCPGQIVISGSRAGIEQAEVVLKEAGARRVLPLNVSGPFHSRLMKPANEKFQASLDEVTLNNIEIPMYATVSAEAITDKDEIKEVLIAQLYCAVHFEGSVGNSIADDVDSIDEVGKGNDVTVLVKK